MSRYPKSARAASLKCIACNAPITRTVEGTYVCVDCGESLVKERDRKVPEDEP